jgi:hypothetical protein
MKRDTPPRYLWDGIGPMSARTALVLINACLLTQPASKQLKVDKQFFEAELSRKSKLTKAA